MLISKYYTHYRTQITSNSFIYLGVGLLTLQVCSAPSHPKHTPPHLSYISLCQQQFLIHEQKNGTICGNLTSDPHKIP